MTIEGTKDEEDAKILLARTIETYDKSIAASCRMVSQYTLSKHSNNTPYQPTLSNHSLSTPYHPPFLSPANPPSQHSFSTPHIYHLSTGGRGKSPLLFQILWEIISWCGFLTQTFTNETRNLCLRFVAERCGAFYA